MKETIRSLRLKLYCETECRMDKPFLIASGKQQGLRSTSGRYLPIICFWEDEDQFELLMELPGMSNEDVEVSTQGNSLTVRGDLRAKSGEEREEHLSCEASVGTFSRSIRIPGPVDADRIEVICQDDTLRIVLPKLMETARPKTGVKPNLA
ncbi:MAG: Hsp20/alpha crystallin family protein [Chloroflexi bacterium]|nr:Hsp20/alpha crystallin family protein [Chloroflexota bacterium]